MRMHSRVEIAIRKVIEIKPKGLLKIFVYFKIETA